MSFLNKLPLLTRSLDGRNFILEEALYYKDDDGTIYAVPAGSESDGVSTPEILWTSDPPFGIERWYSGIIHDASPKYRDTLLMWITDHWSISGLDFTGCNGLIKRALVSQGTPQLKADAYFTALEAVGIVASVSDLNHSLLHIEIPPPPP
jgi:Protein of unknown function (DUF1353)